MDSRTALKGVAIGTEAAHCFKIFMKTFFRKDYWGDWQVFLDGIYQGIICTHGKFKFIDKSGDTKYLNTFDLSKAQVLATLKTAMNFINAM